MKDVNQLLIYLLEREDWLVAVPQKVRPEQPSGESFLAELLSILFEFDSRKVFIPLFGAGSLAFFKQ